jgi:hypothetical protein
MNLMTSINLPLSMYYSFASDVGTFAQENTLPLAKILASLLVHMAKLHPNAYGEMSFEEKRSLKCHNKDSVIMAIGTDAVKEIKALTGSDERHQCLVARALLKEYLSLDLEKRRALLTANA